MADRSTAGTNASTAPELAFLRVARARALPHAGSSLPLPGLMMAQDPRQPDGLVHRSLPDLRAVRGAACDDDVSAASRLRRRTAAGLPGDAHRAGFPGVAATALRWESRPWQVMGLPHLVNSNVISSSI